MSLLTCQQTQHVDHCHMSGKANLAPPRMDLDPRLGATSVLDGQGEGPPPGPRWPALDRAERLRRTSAGLRRTGDLDLTPAPSGGCERVFGGGFHAHRHHTRRRPARMRTRVPLRIDARAPPTQLCGCWYPPLTPAPQGAVVLRTAAWLSRRRSPESLGECRRELPSRLDGQPHEHQAEPPQPP